MRKGSSPGMRHAQAGAWHRLTVQHLIEYAWEFAWRLTMVGRSNSAQFIDLLQRLLTSSRGSHFVRDRDEEESTEGVASDEECGFLVEVPKEDVPKRRGRLIGATSRVLLPVCRRKEADSHAGACVSVAASADRSARRGSASAR